MVRPPMRVVAATIVGVAVVAGTIAYGLTTEPADPPASELPLANDLRIGWEGGSCGSGGCSTGVTLIDLVDSRPGGSCASEPEALRSAGWVEVEPHVHRSGELQADVTACHVTLRWPGREGWQPRT